MTCVTLSYGKNGVLKNCQANGHANFSKKGSDIVCAALSVLLRTAMEVLSHTENVLLTADTSSRGNLAFTVQVKDDLPDTVIRLQSVTDFIRTGIKSLSSEYPENVLLREQSES